MNLYDLTKEQRALQKLLDRGDSDEELALAIMGITQARDQKLESCLFVRKNYAALAEAAKLEAKRLKERAEWAERRVAALDSWVGANLSDDERFECPIGAYSWRISEACVPTEDNPDEIAPEVYTRYEPKPKVKEIKEDLKMGAHVPGWKLEKRNNLQVK